MGWIWLDWVGFESIAGVNATAHRRKVLSPGGNDRGTEARSKATGEATPRRTFRADDARSPRELTERGDGRFLTGWAIKSVMITFITHEFSGGPWTSAVQGPIFLKYFFREAEGAAEAVYQRFFPFAGEGVFPDAEDAPALLAEGAADEAVALAVAADFLAPESPVALRHPAVLGATMPETAVHEDGQPGGAEEEIGFAEEGLAAAPAGEAVGAEDPDEREFGVPVAVGTDAGHEVGALGWGEDVGHDQTQLSANGCAPPWANGGGMGRANGSGFDDCRLRQVVPN